MISIAQIKAARALVGWSQEDLARQSGVSERTVKRLEAAGGPLGGRESTGGKLLTALEDAGIVFLSHGEASATGGEGVRLKPSAA